MTRTYLVEQVDDAAVVQYYADGFEALPLDQKVLIWHLSRAALAGRDIYYDQRYRHALEMREVIEEILVHGQAVAPGVLAEIRRYAKLFWINSGPHNNLTARKFVLTCTPAELAEAAGDAARAGARFPLESGETLRALLERLHGPLFDPAVDSLVTSKTPGTDRDILTASANNLYESVTMSDLEGFEERYGLNSRLVKRNGRLEEEVYRSGGRYGAQIREVIRHLRAALPYAAAPMRRALEALIRFYETGEEADRVAYDEAWVDDRDSPVDTINGFIENYLDARGVKGAWEGIVCYVNNPKSEGLRRLAEAAPWFEARMPWDPKYRRTDVTGVTARAIDVVMETGEAGPVRIGAVPLGLASPGSAGRRRRSSDESSRSDQPSDTPRDLRGRH